MFEDGDEFFRKRDEEAVRKFERPDRPDKRDCFGRHGGRPAKDAGEGFEDFGAEAFGAFGDGNAGAKILELGNTKAKRTGEDAQFARIVAYAVVGAPGRASVTGNRAEVIRLLLNEKLQEEAKAFQ